MPSTVAPSEKVTVPAGVPAPGATAVTVAVKDDRLAEERAGALSAARAVVVAAGIDHERARAGEVAAPKQASPPYSGGDRVGADREAPRREDGVAGRVEGGGTEEGGRRR